MKLRHILIFFIGSLAFSNSHAQSAVLQLDKSFYVTGEIVWYKLYLPNTEANKSAIVNAIVSDKEGKIVEQFYLQANENAAIEGYYKIPFNINSDYYRLSMLGTAATTTTLASIVFPIYNDLEPIPVAIEEAKSNSLNQQVLLEDLVVDIQLDKGQYNPRQAVKASLSVKDKSGQAIEADVSVTVCDANLVPEGLITKNTISGDIGNNINVRGTLMDPAGTPIKASVLGMYSSLEDRIFYCSADEEGQFNMKPPLFYGKRPVQFIGYQFEHNDISIRLQERQMPPIEAAMAYPQFIRDYLGLSQQRKKIFQIYTTLESQLEVEKIKYDVQDLEAAFGYVVDEYESFETMRDFFGELITPLKFILQKDSTYRAELYNPSGLYDANTVLSGEPLFIIDGKLTRDADFVAAMDMDYIETIALMYKPGNLRKKFKAIGRSGVVKMTTNLRDVQIAEKDNADVFTINGLQAKADFPVFQPNEIDTRQPFFRPQLYWNPNIATDKNGRANFTFNQSDDISDFTIRVVVKAKNGEFGAATKTYSVQANQ